MEVQSTHLVMSWCFILAVARLCPYLMVFAVLTGQGMFNSEEHL